MHALILSTMHINSQIISSPILDGDGSEVDTESIGIKDDNGDLPIHIAIENLDDASAKAISLLAVSYPASLVEKGRQDLIPLNLAIKLDANKDVLAAILLVYTSLNGEMKEQGPMGTRFQMP